MWHGGESRDLMVVCIYIQLFDSPFGITDPWLAFLVMIKTWCILYLKLVSVPFLIVLNITWLLSYLSTKK